MKEHVFCDFLRRFEPCGLKADSFSTAYGLAEYTLAVTGRGRDIQAVDATSLTGGAALPVVLGTRPGQEKALVSCGKALGSTEIKIVDVGAAPSEVGEGRVGEVWVSGPSKCNGYWGRPALSDEIFRARLPGDSDPDRTWLRTGDLGFVRDGELFICGRAKDVIIVRGANYYPQDLESIVEEDAAIRRGCVAAFQAADDGGDVVVVAELKKRNHRPDTKALNQEIRKRLGITVDLFLLIPKRTLPKTSSGKISRHRAHGQWQAGTFSIVERVEMRRTRESDDADDALGWESNLQRLFQRYGLTGQEDTTVAEAGLDSLALVDFALDLEKHVEARGTGDLANGIDVRWLQKIPVSELYELVGQLSEAGSHSKLRFRQAFSALRRAHLEDEGRMMRQDALLRIQKPSTNGSVPGKRAGPGVILLTGGTGFFGPFLLRSLLEQTDDRIRVLVRAESGEHGLERLESALAGLGTSGAEIAACRGRVVPVCGDLARPSLGLDPVDWARLSEDVHTIYHNGALVNYLLDYASIRDTNVGSTNELIRLAWSGRPKVFNHISSTFVFGWSSKEILYESDTNPDMELLDFGYSQSKWVSEQLVLQALGQGLSGRIFRPALIAPSTSGGVDNFDIAIRLLAFMLNHGITADTQNQVSLTPADVAANNIVAISRLPDTMGRTFHVTRDAYSSLLDVTGLFGQLTQTEFSLLSVQDFVPTMIERCRKGDLLFPLVNFFVHSIDNITAMEFKRYDSLGYQGARGRTPYGVPDPPLEDVVLGILRFMARRGVIEGRKAELVLATR
ncbi:MAG: AMP-binding protein [Gemmatimonadetes bacterium]|nr:AMP-binding protein [Gemmatimonadota bacterium]